MLSWCNRFNICCFLDNQQYSSSHHQYECLAAAGAIHTLLLQPGHDAFAQLKQFHDQHRDWLFGHLAYDLKDGQGSLSSTHPDGIGFPDICFFVPETIIQLQEQEITIAVQEGADPFAIYQEILQTPLPSTDCEKPALDIQARLSRETYLDTIRRLRQHILRGDCYEINYCQEFYATGAVIDPLDVYLLLSNASPNPFAAYYKIDDRYLLCASPERYLKKEGVQLYSQPIKGTWQRDTANAATDQLNRESLYHSAKDRSENVMVVDLVRNDLSKVCEEGTVQVDELYGIYSFPQVHQMISTISGQLRHDLHFTEALRHTFPMGSMTGAPKKRVMELIEAYETRRRGIFSGSVGYITPDGDFDFNVVIRSILYNAADQYLCFLAGSGITYYSDPEAEYEECLLKAAAIKKVLGAAEAGTQV